MGWDEGLAVGRALEVELECGHLKQRFDSVLVDSSTLTELTGGTEAIFVSDVADFVDDAVRAGVGVTGNIFHLKIAKTNDELKLTIPA